MLATSWPLICGITKSYDSFFHLLYDKERHKEAVMLYNLEKLFLFFMARWAEAIFELLIIALCV